MKYITHLLALVLAATTISLPQRARAIIGTNDVVPAATLLIPYFEVATQDTGFEGTTTYITIINSRAFARVMRVNLWTDQGVPTLSVFIYLTGYDMEVIDLRQLFVNGLVPSSATTGRDPTNLISPKGPLSQDINFANCANFLPAARLAPDERADLIAAHTGHASTRLGGLCGALPDTQRPDIARGFVTIDVVNGCSANDPTSLAYAQDDLTPLNMLLGAFEIRDPTNNVSLVDDAVHLEASDTDPSTDGAGDATFYGHLFGWTGVDHREPLGPRWRTSYQVGGGGLYQTELILFRWAHAQAPFACATPPDATPVRELLVFDTREAVVDATSQLALPAVSVVLRDLGSSPLVPFDAGYVDLDLRLPVGTTTGPPGDRTFVNAVVYSLGRSAGRFAIGMPAIRLPVGGTP